MTADSLSEQQFTEDVTALIPQMRAFARGLCGDATDGDDLAQDGLLRAWSAQARFQAGTNLKAWVFTIIRNEFYSQRRRSWRNVALDQDMAERTLVAIANPTAALELDDLRRAMRMLPDEHREALLLVGAAGHSYEDVSRICGCPLGTAKSRVHRARAHLARILADDHIPKDSTLPSAAMADILSQCERAAGLSLAA